PPLTPLLLSYSHADHPAPPSFPTRRSSDLQSIVGALRNLARLLEQVLFALRIEARIGAQHVQKLGEASGEPGGPNRLLHERTDALHFGEPELVDFVVRRVRRGLRSDENAIHRLSTFDACETERGSRGRQILLLQESDDRALDGRDAVSNQLYRARSIASPCVRRYRRRSSREWLEQRTRLGRSRG